MKISIDDNVVRKHSLSTPEVLAVLLLQREPDINSVIQTLIEKGMITKFENKYYVIRANTKEIQSILCESQKEIPSQDSLIDLVTEMRELFPKGTKTGSSQWRGNLRDITLKLQKFFVKYGTYSPEQILDATKRYVDSFRGDYTRMRILSYFIMKNEVKQDGDGNSHIEEISELANYLENEDTSTSDIDYTLEIR